MSDGKWDLTRISQAEFSALRRCAGIPFGSDMRAAQAFYHAVNGVSGYQEAAWFGAICMQCLWRQEDVRRIVPFERMLQMMYKDLTATESTRKRCTIFLDIPIGDDGFLLGKLCALARIMRAKDGSVMPDFEALAVDLQRWNNTDKSVQRKWIRTICADYTDNVIATNKEEIENVD